MPLVHRTTNQGTNMIARYEMEKILEELFKLSLKEKQD